MNCNKITYDKNCNTIIQDDSYNNDYVFVYVLQLNQTTGIVSDYFIRTEEDQQVIFDLGMDGFYTLVTLKVPKGEGTEYYYKNGNFYHFYSVIEWQTLIEINPNSVDGLDIIYEYYFQNCRLRKCYVNACYQIFDSVASINCNTSGLDKNLVYKRDLLWSALNVIDYMVERDQFEEAERLLERIMGCNGLCNNQQNRCYEVQKSCNCGCS